MKDFKPIYLSPGDDWPDHLQCEVCKERVECGIINVSQHWVKCGGKDFTDDLLKMRHEKGPLTLNDIEELKNKHHPPA